MRSTLKCVAGLRRHPAFPELRETMVDTTQRLPAFLTWLRGWCLELKGKDEKIRDAGHGANVWGCLPPHYLLWRKVLICLSHSKCNVLLLTARHIPDSHKHVAWIWCFQIQRSHHTPYKQPKHEKKHSPLWPKKRLRGKDFKTKLFTTVNYICIQKIILNYYYYLKNGKLKIPVFKNKRLLKL